MPIYRYRCAACSNEDEVLAKISDPPPEACTECGEGPMVKAVARTSFQLKGGGWYAEGYGSSGKKNGDGKSDKSESKSSDSKSSEGKSSTSSDSSASASSASD